MAIGRNYADHARELGNTAPKEPIIFLKPPSSFVQMPGSIELPPGAVVHHEVELAVIMGKPGRKIDRKNAMNHVAGYALALDMTARNWQQQASKDGLPWSLAKGCDTFTPISDFIAREKVQNPHEVQLWCSVDGKMRQNGNTCDMVFDIPTLIEAASRLMRFEEGDVLLTGTPAGVGPLQDGQRIECGMRLGNQTKDLVTMSFHAKSQT